MTTETTMTLTLSYDVERAEWTYHISTPGAPGSAGDDYAMPGALLDDLRSELFTKLRALATKGRELKASAAPEGRHGGEVR